MDKKEIIIGEDKRLKGGIIYGKSYSGFVSVYYENDYQYFQIEVMPFENFGFVSIIVNKGTDEYDTLKQLIEFEYDNKIKLYAQILYIQYSEPVDLYNTILDLEKKSFTRGYLEAKAEVRKALGIN